MHIFHCISEHKVPSPAAHDCSKFRRAERRIFSKTLIFSESAAAVVYVAACLENTSCRGHQR